MIWSMNLDLTIEMSNSQNHLNNLPDIPVAESIEADKVLNKDIKDQIAKVELSACESEYNLKLCGSDQQAVAAAAL